MNPARYRWLIFAIVGAAYLVVYIQRMGLAVIAKDLMLDVSLSDAQMGFLGSAFLYGYALTQMFSGMLAEKFGPRRVVSIFFLVAAAGGLLFASITGFGQAFIGRMFSGVGMAVVLTSALTLFSRWFSTEDYPKVVALYFAVGGVGSLLATTPLSMMNTAFGWRDTFWVIGIITFIIAAGVWLIVRDRPPHGAAGTAPAPAQVRMIPALKKLFTMRNFWCLLCWHASMAGSFYAFAGLWGGVYLEDVYSLSRISIGNMLGMGALGFIFGGPILAWACARGLNSHKAVLAGAGVLGLVFAGLLVFFTDSMNEPMLYAMVLLLGFAANAPNAICFTIARISFGAELSGTSGGFMGFSTFIGGASMQALIGQILSSYGDGVSKTEAFSGAFVVFLVAAGISVVAGLLLHETHGKEEQRIAC